jgi:predicted transcriptional regulator
MKHISAITNVTVEENKKESDSIKRAVGYDEKGNMLFIEHTLKDFQELNKKVKKISEKNKKLKAKNKKLTKKLKKFSGDSLKCQGSITLFDIDENGKKKGKGVKIGNINKTNNTGE